ncbi:MAG: hypothetical protein SFW67_17640 [Myxococcaceae bacterium]|nr:hypothetical protein [Myxococcaceae bacterium]
MTARLLTLLAVVAAPAAFAQFHGAVPVTPQGPAPAVVYGGQPTPPPSCGPRPAPRHQFGRWELGTRQQWVPGTTQQVWVEGACRQHPRHAWKQRCEQGRFVTVQTPGRYQTQQQWVWVDTGGFRHGYGRRTAWR